jgi:hypothetical protein
MSIRDNIVDRYIQGMKSGKNSGFRHYRYVNGQFIGNYYDGPRVVKESAVRESIRASLIPVKNRRRVYA